MSIATEIQRLQNAKASIKSSIINKGVAVPDTAKLDDYSGYINNITTETTPNLQEKSVNPQLTKQTITPDSGYDGLSKVTVSAMPTATQATPSISVSSSGLITASATQSKGYVSAGTKSKTLQLTTKGETTITPSTTSTTIDSGVYTTGKITIPGDIDLVAGNIKSGVSIFGVVGTYAPNLQAKEVDPQLTAQTITPDSSYYGLSKVTVKAMPQADQATPSISVSSSGLITASATQSKGYVSAGTKSATKQLTTKGETTIIPGTTNTYIESGVYTTGKITVLGDTDLVAGNIKSGVSIFGVTGTYAGSGSGGSCNITGSNLIFVHGVSDLKLVEYDTSIHGSAPMPVDRNSIVTTITPYRITSVSSSCQIIFSVSDGTGTWRSAVYVGNVSSCTIS